MAERTIGRKDAGTELPVDDLLALAVTAHGGTGRWDRISRFRAAVSISGAMCDLVGRPGTLVDVVFEGETRDQRVRITPFPSAGRSTSWEPHRQTIETADGAVLAERHDPASTLVGRARDSSWDDFQIAYLASAANWNYFTVPFLFARPDFVVQEIEPWAEGGEVWRRLFVTYPEVVAAQCRQQTYYFDDDGYVRRLDYVVDILGGTAAVQYPSGYREFDGIMVPTRRRVYTREPDGSFRVGRPLVAIDVTRVTFH